LCNWICIHHKHLELLQFVSYDRILYCTIVWLYSHGRNEIMICNI
jgi:hypothetical protein